MLLGDEDDIYKDIIIIINKTHIIKKNVEKPVGPQPVFFADTPYEHEPCQQVLDDANYIFVPPVSAAQRRAN